MSTLPLIAQAKNAMEQVKREMQGHLQQLIDQHQVAAQQVAADLPTRAGADEVRAAQRDIKQQLAGAQARALERLAEIRQAAAEHEAAAQRAAARAAALAAEEQRLVDSTLRAASDLELEQKKEQDELQSQFGQLVELDAKWRKECGGLHSLQKVLKSIE